MFRTMILAVAVAAVSLAGCNDRENFYVAPEKQVADPYLSVQKGMPEADVIKLLGEPDRRSTITDPVNGNSEILRWTKRGIEVKISGGIVRNKFRK